MTKQKNVFAKIIAAAIAATGATGAAHASTAGFITAADRADVAFDTANDVLYISGTDSLRRYDMRSQTFLDSIYLGGRTLGMDISPDGKTLAVANTVRGADRTYVDLVDLASGASSRIEFGRAFGEGGTFTVAFDKQGQLLVSSTYEGSGWVPLRKYDPFTGSTTTLGEVSQDSMLSASGDRGTIGIAEANISDGRWGYYHAGDSSYASQHQWYDPVTGGTSWFNFEIGVSRDGSQFSIPTYGGTFIGDAHEVKPLIGTYAGVLPIGVGYSPVSDIMFLPFDGTNLLAEYDTRTLKQVGSFVTPGTFDWVGNFAFNEGRTKVAGDGSYVFTTLDNGVFYAALPVPEPSTWLLMLCGVALLAGGARHRHAKAQVMG